MFSQCNHSPSGAQAREREEKLEESGEGRGKFSEESFPLPSPLPRTPSSLLSKTFDLIESLLSFFPGGKGDGLSENQKTKKAD